MADEWIVSIDIGSSKIAVVVAEEKLDRLHVIGYTQANSSGVEKGLITNPDLVSSVIKKIINKVGESCDKNLDNSNASINISDNRLTVTNHSSRVLTKGSGKITQKKMSEAIETSSAVLGIANNEVLHSVVNNFIINEDTPDSLITNQPIGMQARTIRANMHIVSVAERNVDSVIQSVSNSGLGVAQVVLDSMAISEAYITEEEKEDGVCLVDIGAGVTNFSIFKNGGITHSAVIQLGGENITKDIVYAFGTSFEEAEDLKIKHGHVKNNLLTEEKLIQFSQGPNSQECYLSNYDLIEAIKKSYLKLFASVKKDINKQAKCRLKAGFVLTGGASKIPGCAEFFMKSSRTKTKLGRVNEQKITGNVNMISDSTYASALGLLLYEADESHLEVVQSQENLGISRWIKGKLKLGEF
ncbi:MAG TPA: cell division protein FtsA [Candidatus Thioglobus sp.]|jgi:cell division protein FtsA|nr:cell division protein FtsA [Candidatus Thioglobus sp.]